MKKHFLRFISMAFFPLFFFACGNEETKINGTTTTTEPATIQAQQADSTHVPYWAEGQDLGGEDVYTRNYDGSSIFFKNFDDMALVATDIVKVEALGAERVELINTWYPPQPPKEVTDKPLKENYAQTETIATPQGDSLLPPQELPSFVAVDLPEEELYRDKYDIYTVYRFRVSEVYQGTTQPGEEIEVMRLGGQLGKFTLVNRNWDNTFAAGDELILFLGGGEDIRSPYIPSWVPDPEETLRRIQNMPLAFISSWQSIYRIMFNGEIESVNPKNDLTLTMADLTRIAEH